MTRALKLATGDRVEAVLVEGLTRTQIVQYAGASGDFNPLHTDEVFATQVAGYPSVLGHGMLTMAMAARLLTDWVGVDDLLSFGARFRSQVWPGDTLTGIVRVETLREERGGTAAEVSVAVRNQEGVDVLTGAALVRCSHP
jgi:acyl dehydratase